MHLAICDDEPAELKSMVDFWKQYDPTQKFEFSCFPSATELLAASKTQQFHIILLDIEMSGQTGFEAAQKLISQEKKPLIIFVTKSPSYSIRGYGLAFRYLLKPLNWTDFRDALDAALAEYESNRLMLHLSDRQTAIRFEDILYIETYDHLTIVHTLKNAYTIRVSLSELTSRLPRNMFVSPQKSYLVNMHYISSVYPCHLILINETTIPISRRKRTEFDVALNDFLGR